VDTKSLQSKVRNFTNKHRLNCPAEFRALDLTSETGEVAKEILKMTNYGSCQPKINQEIALELGDTFFSLIALANSLDVDLGRALSLVLAKYHRRLSKGSPGSENDSAQAP